jgi:hypothetical protein
LKRRNFFEKSLALGGGLAITSVVSGFTPDTTDNYALDGIKSDRHFDVIVVGGGTGGVLAAIAAARTGAKTALIEMKGYTGGTVTEGGTTLHSFFNLWKAFPGVEKRQLVQGIPQEIIDRLAKVGGTSGHCEMTLNYGYDSVCTAVDTELYKMVTMQMLQEAGVYLALNTLMCGVVKQKSKVTGIITESHGGREIMYAKVFIDASGYGDLCGQAGAKWSNKNDHDVCNSMAIANVDMDRYYSFLVEHDAVGDLAFGSYDGYHNQIVRLGSISQRLPEEFTSELRQTRVDLSMTTTVHRNYFMFIKCNYRLPNGPLSRDDVTQAEITIRSNMYRGLELFRKYIPGFERAFISRTAPSLAIRRGRCIECDYDLSNDEIVNATHFDDDVYVYGFHDQAPRPEFQIKNGGSFGYPYRASCVKGFDNLYAIGMMVTSDYSAHMATRNTVSCMAMGQSFGTAAAMCAARNIGIRALPYADLYSQLVNDGVYFEK